MDRRLGIIGTFVWDTVWTLEDQAAGRAFESWGGVSFSMASAAATLPQGWEIVPIAHVGRDLLDRVHDYLDTLAGIGSRDAIVGVEQPNNRVELVYHDAAERGEIMRGGVPGWEWAELAPHLEGLDALYVNFLSGWEVDLPVAEMIGRHFPGFVYADLHSLFLGPPQPDGPRLPRELPRWEEWLRCFRAVQMNGEEYTLLRGERLSPGEQPRWLLEHGDLRGAFITRGERGATWIARDDLLERGSPASGAAVAAGEVAAEPHRGGDPTGCGDVWGAANVCGLLGGLTPAASVARANAVAAVKMDHRGGSGLYQHLRDHRARWEAAGLDG